ncbi:hypothetical protein TWF217_009303 [Orbilia oligospora]|nr:hypothetical protein TWF217_009303 [Orbilia oligospora]
MMGPSKEPLKNYDIDSTGDAVATLISADDDNIELSTLRLSSKILSLVSPVFKSMLDPAKGFKESLLKPNGMKEICITAFSEKSTIVAMNILHYQPESLPGPTEVTKDCAQEVFERMRLQGGKFVVDGKPFHDAMNKYTDVIWHQREKYIQQFTEKVESQYCNFEMSPKGRGLPPDAI